MPLAAITPAVATLIAGGAAAGATAYGAHAAGKSASRAARYQADADRMAMEEARQQRLEEQRRWEAEQAQKQKEYAAAEEERLFDRRLREEREARQAPYRAASAAALNRLGDILGIGNGATGAQALSSAWLSPSQVGRRKPPHDPNQPRTMGDALGMR